MSALRAVAKRLARPLCRMRALWHAAACLSMLTGAVGMVQAQQPPAQVTVFAAASVSDAMNEAARAYEARSGARVITSYAASSSLARQIERGAPADVFVSADLDWMEYLAKKRLVRADSRINLLTNRLVLVAPAGSSVALEAKPGLQLAPALAGGRLAMADFEAVPAGKYGRAALEALGAWKGVERSVVRAPSVRAALAYVARAEAPLGIVYLTDARAEPKVRIVAEFGEKLHPPIVYPAAITAASRSPAARGFLEFLEGAPARAIFQRHGFGTAQ